MYAQELKPIVEPTQQEVMLASLILRVNYYGFSKGFESERTAILGGRTLDFYYKTILCGPVTLFGQA